MRPITAAAVAYDVERELPVPRYRPRLVLRLCLRTRAGARGTFVKSTRSPRATSLDATSLDAVYLHPGGPSDGGNMALSTPLGDTIAR